MPFNQLLLPLLGGYLLINFTYITSYWASRNSKEQLLLASAVVGIIALFVARVSVHLMSMTEWGSCLAALVKSVAPYDGIGTAVAAFLFCLLMRTWINHVWPEEEAALWLYESGKYNNLEQLFLQSVLRAEPRQRHSFIVELLLRLFYLRAPTKAIQKIARRVFVGVGRDRPDETDATEGIAHNDESILLDAPDGRAQPMPMMLSMRDRKVYVGWLAAIPPLRSDVSSYIRLLPSWSGYRDPVTLRVTPTESYDASSLPTGDAPLIKILPISEIANACFYDPEVFNAFQREGDNATNSRGGRARRERKEGRRQLRKINARLLPKSRR